MTRVQSDNIIFMNQVFKVNCIIKQQMFVVVCTYIDQLLKRLIDHQNWFRYIFRLSTNQ